MQINFHQLSLLLKLLSCAITCNNSIFNNKNYLQTDGTAQGLHMSSSYADLALATFDNRALAYNCSPTSWRRFRDNVFVVWAHGSVALN